MGLAIPYNIIRESRGDYGGRGHTVLKFYYAAKLGYTSRTAVSAANTEDHAIRLLLK
jgi:hypothetical protein